MHHVSCWMCGKDKEGREIISETTDTERINSREVRTTTTLLVVNPDGTRERVRSSETKHDPLPPPLAGVWGS